MIGVIAILNQRIWHKGFLNVQFLQSMNNISEDLFELLEF